MEAPAANNEPREARNTLVEALTRLGAAAVDPAAPDGQAAQQLADLLQKTRTVALLPALNALVVPGRVPEAARLEFISQLARLPMRNDGVRATLEFVFSVHPASSGGDASNTQTQTQKEGAQITPEALKMATRLLASPAQRVSADDWFRALAPQLLSLLDGHDGLDLAKVAAYVIGFGVLGRKSYGAPGMPGWTSFAEPMLRCIDPTAGRVPDGKDGDDDDDNDVVRLGKNAQRVIVSSQDVAKGLTRLQTLVLAHPNPGLTRRLLGAVVLPLWALSSWTNTTKRCEDDYCLPARNLLRIYLRITVSPDRVMPIVRDLLFAGCSDADHGNSLPWQYSLADPAGNSICIVAAPGTPLYAAEVLQTRWSEIGPKADALIDLLATTLLDDEDISSVFLSLFGRWLGSRQKKKPTPAVLVKEEDTNDDTKDDDNPLASVLEGTMLQKMMEKFPDKLAGRPDHVLELVEGLLGQADGDNENNDDDTLPVVLSLLNLVVTSPGFRRARADAATVQSIETSLERIGHAAAEDNAKTARNLLMLLKYRDELDGDDPSTGKDTPSAAAIEDRKTYSLAMSYIMQADAPPPVRSEGLLLLQGLIQANSPVLDIPALLVLLSSLLGDNEDYVNLRVISTFTLLANRHPKATTKELLDGYADVAETRSVDARLRFGEALLQVVQRLGATFAGDTAQQVGQALLDTAGRRGHRPKTAAKQARDARMQEMRGKKGDDNDNDSDDSDDDDPSSPSADNKILASIVQGWGSKRGSEDVRIRASALSILGTAIEVNLAGLGAALASDAVDLALHVLAMESSGLETAILRRAAIVLVLAFVRALHDAREARRRLGFGLTQQSHDDIVRVLEYVAGSDNDGLVRQHAVDVIESLHNWQLTSLLPREHDDAAAVASGPVGGLASLAGLSVNPANLSTSLSARPRIEEVE